MKIVLLGGSGRPNGNTGRLLRLLEAELQKTALERGVPLEVEQVALAKREIGICRGCRRCFDKGECPLEDEVPAIRQLIDGCDALVMASPVYMEDVNGITKNWIDRMAYCAHRPAFYGKCAAVLSTSGAGSTSHTLQTMKNALTVWGFQVVAADKFRMGALMDTAEAEKLYTSRLAAAARKLTGAIAGHAAEKPSLYALIAFAIQQKYYNTCPRAGELDRAYWEEKGWLDPRAVYYAPIRCNPAKRVLARVMGAALAKLFV